MNDFAAIDFETANAHRTSVCSVGVVIVRNGQVVSKYYSLICPEPNYYSHFTTAIHGLTRADTDEARPFYKVWAEIEPLIEGLPLVAHNKAFDESCLKAVMAAYSMDYPDYPFFCTLVASRRQLPQLPCHKLDVVARACGYDLHAHHHALADAEACAAIALQLL